MKRFLIVGLVFALGLTAISGCNKKLSSTSTDPEISLTFPTDIPETEPVVEKDPETFEELYGNQLMSFMNHQYTFDGKEIPLTESNFYVVDAFIDLSNYAAYGYYPITKDGYIDLAAKCDDPEYKTYGDYMIGYAENSLQYTYILNKWAASEDITLSEETKASIDELLTEFTDGEAKDLNKTLDEYLQFYYGPGMTSEEFKVILEHYYLADAYSEHYYEHYSFSDDEKKAPNIRYALFYVPNNGSEADKEKALNNATDMKNSCETVDELSTYIENHQTIYDHGDIVIARGETVESFDTWSFDPSRQEGDIDLLYSPEYGYFVVGYLGLVDQDEEALKTIAMDALYDAMKKDIDSNKYNFGTEDVYTVAPAAPTATPVPTNPYAIYEDYRNQGET